MATSAAWLKFFLAPIEILSELVKQTRDNRLNFSRAFTFSQVADADGIDCLTVDIAVANTSYEPTANTIPIRNGSGTLKGNVITATSFTYVTPITVTGEEPFASNAAMESPANWVWDFNRFPNVATVGATWVCDLKPPTGSLLKTVSVVFTPAGAHGALPVTTDLPLLGLVSYDDAGASISHGAVYDAPASIVDYEQKRTLTITIGGGGIVVDATRRYLLIFRTEMGVNAVTGTILQRQGRWTAEVSTP